MSKTTIKELLELFIKTEHELSGLTTQRADTLESLCAMQEQEIRGGMVDRKAYSQAKASIQDIDIKVEACRGILAELRGQIQDLVIPEAAAGMREWTSRFGEFMEERKRRFRGFLRGLAVAYAFHFSLEGSPMKLSGDGYIPDESLPVLNEFNPHVSLERDDLLFLEAEIVKARKSAPSGPDTNEMEFLLRQEQTRLETVLREDPAIECERLIQAARQAQV